MVQHPSSNLIPSFPSDLAIAPISRISFSEVVAGNADEELKVLEACQTHGFFYLDLQHIDVGELLLSDSDGLLQLARQLFDLPTETKREYALRPGAFHAGFKPAGNVKRTDGAAKPDTTEFFNIAKDHMHGVTESRPYPAPVMEQKHLVANFQKRAHSVGLIIMNSLARQLGLPADAFNSISDLTRASGDHCRLTYRPGNADSDIAIGLASHTDFGLITLLFNWLGGLQIQSHEQHKKGVWEFVKPEPGCAIVNLGDAMVTLTNGLLKSAKHRVVPPPGEQAGVNRYSVVYFARPHNEVKMEPFEKFKALHEDLKVAGKFEPIRGENGEALTAQEWVKQRALQVGN